MELGSYNNLALLYESYFESKKITAPYCTPEIRAEQNGYKTSGLRNVYLLYGIRKEINQFSERDRSRKEKTKKSEIRNLYVTVSNKVYILVLVHTSTYQDLRI